MKRCTTGLRAEEVSLLAAYAEAGTPAHRALADLAPEVPLRSESSVIRALLLVGHRTVEEERLRLAYDEAVAAGEVDDETIAWHAAAARHTAGIWGQG